MAEQLRPVEPGGKPAPKPQPKSIFSKPGLFTAWGLKNGQWTPADLAALAKQHGFGWICQQVGDPNIDPDDATLRALASACVVHGLQFGIWEWSPKDVSKLVEYAPHFWVLNVEHPWDGYATFLPEVRKRFKTLDIAVITNDDLDPKPFVKANVKAIPEAYQVDNPQATPANMIYETKKRGWKKVFPCVGVYGGYPLLKYNIDGADGYSIYLAEEMGDADWKLAASWNKPS